MQSRTSVTIRDVAEAAGVSLTTASRVLNQRASLIPVSAATIERVREAANRLGYQPNVFARGLRGQRTHLLGCLFADMGDPFLYQIAQAAQTAASARGYRFLIADEAEDIKQAAEGRELFGRTLVDGVFILGDLLEGRVDRVPHTLEGHRHVVVFGRGGIAPSPFVSVGVDNEGGTSLLLDHLYDLGHRRIAYIGCSRNLDMQVRCTAFRAFAAERDLVCPDSYIRHTAGLDYSDGHRAFREILALTTDSRPTALFAANDRLAIGALHAAVHAGLRVPEDLSIGGFDGLPVSAFVIPPLTTVQQPAAQIGISAVKVLLDMIEAQGGATVPQHIVLQPKLIVRESTVPPREHR